MTDRIIKFLRSNEYKFVRELGAGACGRTVELYDDIVDEHFVCKKYEPQILDEELGLFDKFIQEIKLLYKVNHRNLVRVFNYHIYPEQQTAYILMERVLGSDIDDYLKESPEKINDIFRQAVAGFQHLEKSNVLHRDIRPMNILVSEEGELKIIDFGFGKQPIGSADYENSVQLNWWCDPPSDLKNGTYDYCTEIYFVGKLFERIISENQISSFQYGQILENMCSSDADSRFGKFSEISFALNEESFAEIEFDDNEKQVYRMFSDELIQAVTKIETDAKLSDDPVLILRKLQDLYRRVMLEQEVPANNLIVSCFVTGGNYYFSKKRRCSVLLLKDFIELLTDCSQEKRNIIVDHIITKLSCIDRYTETGFDNFDDDIPF